MGQIMKDILVKRVYIKKTLRDHPDILQVRFEIITASRKLISMEFHFFVMKKKYLEKYNGQVKPSIS